MKPQIFKNFTEFSERSDKTINGVSPEFADKNPDYEEENITNVGCWNCKDCDDCYNCNGCNGCYECYECYDCSYCNNCRDCNDCSYCDSCDSCRDCRDCSYCDSCSGKNDNASLIIPKIDDIHKKVFSAVRENTLDMRNWHKCETTHCRAGWVVHLAGEMGYELEEYYGPCLAAQLIYRESGYGINPCRFFDSEKDAMNDIKRLAEI